VRKSILVTTALGAAAAGVLALPAPAHAADSTPPLVLLTVPTPTWTSWYDGDVTIDVGAVDLGGVIPAGLQSVTYTLTGAQSGSGSIPLKDNVSAQGQVAITAQGLTSLSVTATDKVGNSRTETRTIGVDKSVPTVTWSGKLNQPAPVFVQGEQLILDYSCSDPFSGVARCDGEPHGVPLDTAELGTHELGVVVQDNVGNGALVLHQYQVVEAAIRLSGAPTVSGTPTAGQRLTATPPAASGPASASFGYTWTRDGAPIAGASAASYALTAADAGHSVGVTVTATAAGFESATASSPGVSVGAAVPSLSARFQAKRHGKVKLTISLTAPGLATDGVVVTVKKGAKTVGTGTVRGGRVVITLKRQPAKRTTYTLTSTAGAGLSPATVRVSGKVR
jgi:hypothetical protein